VGFRERREAASAAFLRIFFAIFWKTEKERSQATQSLRSSFEGSIFQKIKKSSKNIFLSERGVDFFFCEAAQSEKSISL